MTKRYIEDYEDRQDYTGHKRTVSNIHDQEGNRSIQKKDNQQTSTGAKGHTGLYMTPFHQNLPVFSYFSLSTIDNSNPHIVLGIVPARNQKSVGFRIKISQIQYSIQKSV
jgi:hypothetical protein